MANVTTASGVRVALVALAIGSAQPARAEVTKVEDVGVRVSRLLGRDVLEVLLGAERVEIYRLVDPMNRRKKSRRCGGKGHGAGVRVRAGRPGPPCGR
jgi:hypothetical protein